LGAIKSGESVKSLVNCKLIKNGFVQWEWFVKKAQNFYTIKVTISEQRIRTGLHATQPVTLTRQNQ